MRGNRGVPTTIHRGSGRCRHGGDWFAGLRGGRRRQLERQRLHRNRRLSEAYTWDSVGYAYHHLGQHEQAIACYRHALRLFRELGDRYFEARILVHLGEAHEAAGQPEPGREALRQALAILDALGHPTAAEVRKMVEP